MKYQSVKPLKAKYKLFYIKSNYPLKVNMYKSTINNTNHLLKELYNDLHI